MGALSWGLVQQPMIGESACGDAHLVIDQGETALVAVVDGLGHGAEAEVAAKQAIRCAEGHAEKPPERVLEACHQALRGTRGVVMGIARIDKRRHLLAYAGLGNIEARIIGAERTYRPVSVNGIVGHSARKFRVEEFPFHPGDLLVLHTDGVSDRFELSALARDRDLQQLASQLAHSHGRHHDDQLLLVVREAP